MTSGSKRQRPNSIKPLRRQRTRHDPSPAPPAPPTSLPTTCVSQRSRVESSPGMSALKTFLEGPRDNPIGLPPLQIAVSMFLECTAHLQLQEQNRQAYDELALDLANLVTILQIHVAALDPHDVPSSIANVARVIDEQTQLIKMEESRSRVGKLALAKDDAEAVLKCCRMVGALFQRMQTDIQPSLRDELRERDMGVIIKDLSPVHNAYYNVTLPVLVTKRVGCTPGTRMKILETFREWMYHDGEGSAKIYWLNGMAGTGKTTIAYTLCEMLQRDGLLAASFFCSRDSLDCQDVGRIVPTIAYQLARYSSLYQQELLKALKSYSDVSKRDIGAQFRHLISEPFEKISQKTSKDAILVIDALDECANKAGSKIVLDTLIQHAAELPIKLFVASRPEPAIFDSMTAHDGALRSIFWLHDIEESLAQADIKLYLTEALASIDVSPSEIDQLVARAGNLFIFAATTVRYIMPDEGAANRRQRLQAVLELQPSQVHESYQDIDKLYTTILANALDEKIYGEKEITARRQVLKTVICAREPLPISALSEILCMSDEEDVLIAIQPLQSLLYVSANTNAVSALHASFPDFLLVKERAGQFYCDEVLQNSYLAESCFGLMGRLLRFNICELESSYVFDKDVPNLWRRIDTAISPGLFYSCKYWSDHLTSGSPSPASRAFLERFLQQHLLYWMEVLNLKEQISHGESVLSQALAWLPAEAEWAEIRNFTYDARNFLTLFASNPVSLSTPHIYVSVLPFTYKDSRVRATYWKRTQGLVQIEGAATEGRGKSALATWAVGGEVISMTRSSDGSRVASGSDKNEVSVWDLSSGVRILGPLEGHQGDVYSVVFSPNNSRIVSGSSDSSIRVWDAHDGSMVVGPLHGHTSGVVSLAFSPDGTRLASGSRDHTIRIWDAPTGVGIGDAYRGHRGTVSSVAFSPDGEHLASGSADRTIRVWNWRVGVAALKTLKGHTGPVNSISYSPDRLYLASGSEDRTVRVWNMPSGTLLAGPFEGHTGFVTSVSFSPDGTQIVSGSVDRRICVWEAKSGHLLAGPLEGHAGRIEEVLFVAGGTRILSGSRDGTIRVWDARQGTAGQTQALGHSGGIHSVAMSPDGTRAASGSRDKKICVWDTHNGALVAGPFKGHTKSVMSVAFSPDGERIVSGSRDKTLRIWEASTGALLAGPFTGHTDFVFSAAFSSRDGAQIASGSWDDTIQLWDSHLGGSVARALKGHTHYVASVAFSPDGARIVSGSYDHTARMWDANKGITLWTSNAHAKGTVYVAFSPDGTQVAFGSDRIILVLNASDGEVLHGPFTGHTGYISSVAFSPDGTYIVSSSRDRTVCVWRNIHSGSMIAGPLKGHTDEVRSVAFSPDGARIISGSYDGTIRFWNVAAASRPDVASFDGWFIADDGWLTDSQSRLLLWVPSDLRHGFWFPTPSNPLVSNARSVTHIDQTTLLGERWRECYDASSGSAPF